MLKNQVRLECIVNDKTGYFYLDSDTPIPVAKEMIFQFQKYLGQVEDQIKAQQDQAAKEAAEKEPESKVELIAEQV